MQLHYINKVTLNFDVELTSIKIHLPQTVSWYLWSASFVAVESTVWTWKCSNKSLQLLKMKIVCRGGQYDDISSDGWINIDRFISCFVVHFGTSSEDPWLRGRWQSAGSEKSDTEQKTAFHKIGRHPVFHILAVSDTWRLLVMSKSERHYVADLTSAELLAIVGKSIWSDILSIWLSVDSLELANVLIY